MRKLAKTAVRNPNPILIITLLSMCYLIISGIWIFRSYQDWLILSFHACMMAIFCMLYFMLNKKHQEYRKEIHRKTSEQIKHMAYYDDLTGLPNRRTFRGSLQELLVQSKSEHKRFTVFYMNVDRFKLINESLNHDYGDMLLLQIAERLTRCIKEGEMVVRIEADDFAMYFPEISTPEAALKRAHCIQKVLLEPFVLKDKTIHITASIGVSISSDGDTPESLMQHAELALSQAKEFGRNSVQLYDTVFNERSMERLNLENDMRNALEKGEYQLYYQPQISIHTGRIVGAEALIRWNHPVRGMVPPDEFIPLAEDTGFIVEIGEWVLREACTQNKKWQDMGYPPFPVSVNLSVRQFLQQKLKEKVQGILEETGLDARYLVLEITESMTSDVDYATNCLLELKSLGLQISIDDFGKGYSSLSYLKKFPISTLKIDQSFVRDLMEDPNDAAIVSTIIAMAHHLKLKVIAEGVETEEQLKYLTQNKCNEVQGYLFSPPLPDHQFEQKLQEMIS
ncbi:putative bifunctional diguanylate cyclase/phosphodiesterase [Marinicrinis lubricantis]|uniref:Bifunctional diguanylate cyclase/phosphodiesterase n=1 Tax=Marinicrinis lubricantis TaxID=2086470 RepID=A0ABW1IIX7_9BACL